ncbi:transposase [Flagellatimonas centrodinii]|uniref:transposase n=1 Tax=Flagellatimonas centrodinii TaxID=2806210 RepID=UPI001FEE41BA|nr:transposase [Flagellatimonas centrodinii]ULQ46733.1 transposase [Flagellatimonas centrodinii]
MTRNSLRRDVASDTDARVKSRYTPRQIMAFLRDIDEGRECSIAQACQRMNISRQTYYYWRARYGHAGTSAAPTRLMAQLDRDIRKLSEQLAAQQALLEDLRGQLGRQARPSSSQTHRAGAASNGNGASVSVRQGV